MKKLAFVLALVVVLSCCMLASCGGSDDTSSAASSAAAAESSVAEAASSEAAAESSEAVEESSEAEPSEDVSEPEESSELPVDPDAPVGDGSNLALNKTYEISQLYQQGGAEDNWGWKDGIDPTYPDEDGKTLTDGVLPEEGAAFSAEEWMGFANGCPDYQSNGYSWMRVDLGETFTISKIVLYVGGSALGGGIGAPSSVTYLVSDDGENFTPVETVVPTDDGSSTVVPVECEATVSARYIEVRMCAGNWMFVGELEVF